MSLSLSDRLKNITKPQVIKAKLDKSKNKEMFSNFKATIIPKLESLAEKNIKSYQVPIDNWEISDNIEKWCKKNGLRFWRQSRKVGHVKPFKETKLKVDEVRLMMISWE